MITRRRFLCSTAGATLAGLSSRISAADTFARNYHACLSPDVVSKNPEILKTVRDAGCSHVWIAAFFYGYWPYSKEILKACKEKIEKAGMTAQIVNVPLGHPGDSLGSSDGGFPLTPPKHWKLGVNSGGRKFAGTSLHAPATEENAKAVKEIEELGFGTIFVDDDFRLAQAPGTIGGCWCDEHRKAFLEKSGFDAKKWDDLRADADNRRFTPMLKAWLDYSCDELTACFRAQQKALTKAQMGIMVMYLGSEKAGIRLSDYKDAPLRVGESQFDDGSFGSIKGKTSELFSVLFHRRFVTPALAHSETTAYPANRLSANNMAAKLAISTIADVRNTMYMSGLTPFPETHWATLGPAMKHNAKIHATIAGQTPRGPLKHFWGEHSRYVSDDNPNALFLACGVPFEVTETPASDGWTFLSNADAAAVTSGALKTAGTTFVVRPGTAQSGENIRVINEKMEDLFVLKREILPKLGEVPYVVEDKPVVCAWYPAIKSLVLWNLSETKQDFTVRFKSKDSAIAIEGLGIAIVDVA